MPITPSRGTTKSPATPKSHGVSNASGTTLPSSNTPRIVPRKASSPRNEKSDSNVENITEEKDDHVEAHVSGNIQC